MKPTSSNGPTTRSVRYSATRRARLRGEDSEAYGSHDAAAHPVRELHDSRRQLAGSGAPDGAEEFVHNRLEIMTRADDFEDDEGERYHGDNRKE
jgi:hypothetical protein